MSRCDEPGIDILLYLDNALNGQKLEDFRAHLAGCSDCKARLEEERALSCLLRETRPLYLAPKALRARVAVTAAERFAQASASSATSDRSRTTRMQHLMRRAQDVAHAVFGWKPLVALTLVLVLSLIFVPGVVQRVRATNYIQAATDIHRSYLDGALPLQCQSRSPEVVTAWFGGKTPFRFQLPASQSVPNGKAVYWLTGARLVSYQGSPAALVAYETPREKISLLVASSKYAVVAGGEEVRSGDLTFHYRSGANSEVITWTNHGLAYALVSPLTGSPQHSCLVCHQSMADQNLFKH
jgi:anti-sigma factor RsiW